MSEDPTQISLRTVLEAINGIGVELHQFREEVVKRFEQLEAEIAQRFEGIESSINVLSGDVTRLRGQRVRGIGETIAEGTYGQKRETALYPPGSEAEGKDKRT